MVVFSDLSFSLTAYGSAERCGCAVQLSKLPGCGGGMLIADLLNFGESTYVCMYVCILSFELGVHCTALVQDLY